MGVAHSYSSRDPAREETFQHAYGHNFFVAHTSCASQTNPNDGAWHMVTVSTQPQSFAGYRLFLDGELAGELTGSSMTANRTGNIQVTYNPTAAVRRRARS